MIDDIIATIVDKFVGDSAKDRSLIRWFFLLVVLALIILVAV